MDRLMLLTIRRYVGRSRLLDRLMVHVGRYGPLWFFVVMGAMVVLGGSVERRAVLLAIIAATITRGLTELIGRQFYRARPFLAEGFTPLLQHRPSASFPSNHSACGFALAVALWLHLPLIGAYLVLFAGVLALSRVYVGLHYPSDVFFGALLGASVAWLLVQIC